MRHKTIVVVGGLALTVAIPACTNAGRKHANEVASPAERLEPRTCGSISRVHTHAGLWLASQPTPADFAQARKSGVKTVINLRHPAEIKDFDERQVVEAEGMQYISLPFKEPAELTDKVFDSARHHLKTAERPILMHCGSASRVGAVWLPFRVLDEGLSYDEALIEAKIVGLKNTAYEAKARDYIAKQR